MTWVADARRIQADPEASGVLCAGRAWLIGGAVVEASWVRSVYLYAMCAVSVGLVLVGLSTTAVGLVHTAAPDLGHRDTLDRVGIGLSNIGSDVVDLFNESQLSGVEDFCRDVSTTESDFDDCVRDEQSSAEDSFGSISEGIAKVKEELRSQIRNNSVDQMIRGLLMVLAGLVIFRVHGRRTELFADGLVPTTPAAVSGPTTEVPLGPPPTAR
jgi:hypothetical protein